MSPCRAAGFPPMNQFLLLLMFADNGSLSDNYARAVVDKEIVPDGCPRVNIDACYAVGMLGHYSWYEGYPLKIKDVGYPIHRYGVKAGITEYYLLRSRGSRVALVYRLGILYKLILYGG